MSVHKGITQQMIPPSTYKALIVDPDPVTRTRLYKATADTVHFGSVHLADTIMEATFRLKEMTTCDMVFLSAAILTDDIATFVTTARHSPAGQNAIYILVGCPNKEEVSNIAIEPQTVADTFLAEPFTADTLGSIVELVPRIRRERAQAQRRAALIVFLSDIMAQIDRMAFLKSQGIDVTRRLRSLKEMCIVFQSLSGASLKAFYDVTLEAFENARLQEFERSDIYSGSSTRVKKRQQAKLVAELEAEEMAASERAAELRSKLLGQ